MWGLVCGRVGAGDFFAGGGGERGEGGGYLLDEVVVVEIAGGGEDHVGGGEAAGVFVEDDLLGEAGDGFGGAEDGAAEGVVGPEVLGEELVDEVVGIVFVHLDLFEDDALFLGDVFGGEGGVEDEVGEEVEGGGDVFVEDLEVEADGFFAGEGVEVAADGVDFAGELLGGARGGALEDHVLDEVGDAVDGGGLVAGAGVDPDAHGDGAEVGHALGEDEEAVGERGGADVAEVRGGRGEGGVFGEGYGDWHCGYCFMGRGAGGRCRRGRCSCRLRPCLGRGRALSRRCKVAVRVEPSFRRMTCWPTVPLMKLVD